MWDLYHFHAHRCPGLYCGRTLSADGWSDCGACERGFRANSTSFCSPCNDNPDYYDIMYLGFMVFLPLVLHWICIDNTIPKKNIGKTSTESGAMLLHFSAFLEIVLAAILTIFLADPIGHLSIRTCRVRTLSDWYTLFYNPRPEFAYTLHCTQEAVYPRHTIVFIFYCLAVFFMLLVRSIIIKLFVSHAGASTIYAALYFFPILALFHAVFGGLIYFTFPYIVLVLSIISNAAHFAYKMNQSMKYLVLSTLTDLRNIVIVLGHWLVHAYGITSLLVGMASIDLHVIHFSFLGLVPLPAIFYILTSKFTDPLSNNND